MEGLEPLSGEHQIVKHLNDLVSQMQRGGHPKVDLDLLENALKDVPLGNLYMRWQGFKEHEREVRGPFSNIREVALFLKLVATKAAAMGTTKIILADFDMPKGSLKPHQRHRDVIEFGMIKR